MPLISQRNTHPNFCTHIGYASGFDMQHNREKKGGQDFPTVCFALFVLGFEGSALSRKVQEIALDPVWHMFIEIGQQEADTCWTARVIHVSWLDATLVFTTAIDRQVIRQ